jgi:hypothetical protein
MHLTNTPTVSDPYSAFPIRYTSNCFFVVSSDKRRTEGGQEQGRRSGRSEP